jgi:hypothetical protein
MNKLFLKCVLAIVWVIIIASLFVSCSKLNEYSGSGKPEAGRAYGPGLDIVYIQTNNSNKGQNGILAYQVYSSGHAELLPGSPFITGGTGFFSPLMPAIILFLYLKYNPMALCHWRRVPHFLQTVKRP